MGLISFLVQYGSSAGQEVPHFHGTRRFVTVFQNPLFDPVLSHLNPVCHLHTLFLYGIHFNIILKCTFRSPNLPFPLRFPDWNVVCISHLSHACHMSYKFHSPCFNYLKHFWVKSTNYHEMGFRGQWPYYWETSLLLPPCGKSLFRERTDPDVGGCILIRFAMSFIQSPRAQWSVHHSSRPLDSFYICDS